MHNAIRVEAGSNFMSRHFLAHRSFVIRTVHPPTCYHSPGTLVFETSIVLEHRTCLNLEYVVDDPSMGASNPTESPVDGCSTPADLFWPL